NGNYALRHTSPGVDAGLRLAVAGTTDLLGAARSQGTAIDIGAYEFDAPDPTPTPEISGTAQAVGDLRWRSESNGWGPAEVDMSNGERPAGDGQLMRIGSSQFDKGIGTHAPSRIVIDLPEGCTTFLADVGLDEEVGDQGTVTFEVVGDGKLLATSGLLFATDDPVPLMADVTGVNQLELVVTPGGDGNAFDHADWGDARLDCAA
ncbi:MAG TPA: NPCBM/NEW2 domain-containing protein, partial [Actinomycetes bacterium]|nr:NPCBM/NEW2 domain-containing protein [Actinomycetes bacterium]